VSICSKSGDLFTVFISHTHVSPGCALETRDSHFPAQAPLAPPAKVALVALLALRAVWPVRPHIAGRPFRAAEARRAGPAREALVARADAPLLARQTSLAHLGTKVSGHVVKPLKE
jgi:hypothetical protein